MHSGDLRGKGTSFQNATLLLSLQAARAPTVAVGLGELKEEGRVCWGQAPCSECMLRALPLRKAGSRGQCRGPRPSQAGNTESPRPVDHCHDLLGTLLSVPERPVLGLCVQHEASALRRASRSWYTGTHKLQSHPSSGLSEACSHCPQHLLLLLLYTVMYWVQTMWQATG